ncbi:uncharacterized protein [Nicotiana sylvestris]|uniref:uncharacterized protein n=1 Tax=Nicotiana sylvestris TaxID=4096 RepID=UPI00388C78F7
MEVQPGVVAQIGDGVTMSADTLWRLDRFTKLFTTTFSGASSEDPQDYLDSCHEVLRNMGIVETNGVNFAAFHLSGSAKTWWRDYCLARPAGLPSLSWEQFSALFLEKFLSVTQREAYRRQFERLQQGSIMVTQYETRSIDRARHALMAKKAGSEIIFQEAANVARRVEIVLSQGGCHRSDKRPRYSGRFNGTSSGGRDSYGRDYPPRPFQSTLQVSHGTSGGRGSHMHNYDQQPYSSPPTPIGAPPLQSFRGVHLGRHVQQQRACYTCGEPGHIARFCPRAPGSSQYQRSRAMVLAPGVPHPAQPARGGGRGARGGGRGHRGGAQTARDGGQPIVARPRDIVQGGGA